MKFGEKIYIARRELRLSRQDLADITGLSKRTIAYYELDGKLPRRSSTCEQLARALHMDVNTLMNEDAELVLLDGEAYSNEGSRQAEKLLSEIRGLYAGGALNEQDMDAMMLAIQDAYWIAKKKSAGRRRKSGNDELV